jgi:hypothetical protein
MMIWEARFDRRSGQKRPDFFGWATHARAAWTHHHRAIEKLRVGRDGAKNRFVANVVTIQAQLRTQGFLAAQQGARRLTERFAQGLQGRHIQKLVPIQHDTWFDPGFAQDRKYVA